jgi:metalloprotease
LKHLLSASSSIGLFSAVALALSACTNAPAPSTAAPASPTAAKPATAEAAPAGGGALGALGALAGAATSGGSGASSGENKLGAGLDLVKAATVSEGDLKSAALQMRAYNDKRAKVAAPGSKYGARLAKLTAKHVNEDGLTLNFKAYISSDVNANASADGSVRVYSGLMDKLNDAELLAVIGHEIGHVKMQHTMSRMRTGYLASAGRKAAASSSGVLGALADSELGDLSEAVLKGQFSQSQETDSDDYGLAFMKKHRYDVKAVESALRKLAALSSSKGGLAAMTSSHPDPAKRADRQRDRAAGKGQ